MAELSAADLQKRHVLEGAPDPFPSLGGGDHVQTQDRGPARSSRSSAPLDTESELSFPSLAPSVGPGTRTVASAWSASAPRIQPAVQKQALITDSFTHNAVDLSAANRDGKPTTLGEVLKTVMGKFKVKIEASSNQRTKQTTFHLKSESGKELEKAKRMLIAMISRQVSVVLNAPASTIATIIGPKGATLKAIRDQTTVKVDIPRKETHANGHADPAAQGDEEEEPTVPVTITGPEPLVEEAQGMLNRIIASKTSRLTQRVRDIPEHVIPFIKARREEFLAAANGGGDVELGLRSSEREFTAMGNREAVLAVVEKVKATISALEAELTKFEMSLPKRQHRLLAGKANDEIMAASKCVVVVPSPDDSSDKVIVWGKGDDLANGMAAIMKKANSQYIHEYPLPGPISLSRQIVAYMTRTGYARSLSAAHPNVNIYPPSPIALSSVQSAGIDIVGEKASVEKAVEQLSTFIASLMGGLQEVEVDWLLHRIIQGKNSKKIKQIFDVHNVRFYFPDESKEESKVLLVYEPGTPNAKQSLPEKAKHVADAEKELLKFARDAADVKSELVPVESKWHSFVAGKDGTTLNAIIGEDKALSIKIGAEAGGDTENVILVRGASADVDRAVKEILQIVENAKTEQIDNSYSVEFEIAREYVGRVVGSHGAAVNKLRDTLGVRVDFTDEAEDREKDSGKKKKTVQQKSKVKITGRKENVEEAKKRILTQVERLADETSEVLKIPTQYHSSLIGQSGKYVIRLEEKYGVKITFPREAAENGEGKTRESLKPDEVLIKGGKKGVASAKSELVDAVEFEKESNNMVKFSVPTRAVARILGKGGATINEIKDSTGVNQIDVDKGTDDPTTTVISCRGTKKAIAAAKAEIVAIADQVGEELTVSVTVENRFHRNIIGAGGQGLRDLVTRCGGPSDPRMQAGLIRFPRQGEPSDEVRLRGDPGVVKKIQAELERIAADLRDRIVLVVEVPNVQHRALIGRAGRNLNDLQARTGAQIQFPGSRSYDQVGEAENIAELKDVNPQDLVKVAGPRAACEKAIAELKAHNPPTPQERVTGTISVPLKYHHFVTQQGQFLRNLRSIGVNVEHSAVPQKPAVPARISSGVAPARVDDPEEDEAERGVEWRTVPNVQDAEEGDSEWTLSARDADSLERAKTLIAEAINEAEKATTVGFLTLPDRSAFPRIVGTKGANVSRLRMETGADITVGRDDNTIILIGSDSSIEAAKEAILRIAASRGGRRE